MLLIVAANSTASAMLQLENVSGGDAVDADVNPLEDIPDLRHPAFGGGDDYGFALRIR